MANLLRTIKGTFQKTWTNEEINLLAETYPTVPMQELLKLFPGKTEKAVSRIAERNGIKKIDPMAFIPRGKDSPQWRGGKMSAFCEYCNGSFEYYPSRNTHKYCSYQCARADMKKEKHPQWEGGDVELICEQCYKAFRVKPSESDGRRFCSKSCMVAHEVGENHHAWRGGLSFEPYPPTFNARFKRMIRERDGYICKLCGGYGDSVHHINYVKNDTVPKNCITLCRSCHARTNSNREYWQDFFAKIMEVCS